MRRFRRWFNKRFRTTVRPTMVNRFGGRMISTSEWKGWADALVPGWEVGRPDWWGYGGWSGVSDVSLEVARQRLDEWQDDMARRA